MRSGRRAAAIARRLPRRVPEAPGLEPPARQVFRGGCSARAGPPEARLSGLDSPFRPKYSRRRSTTTGDLGRATCTSSRSADTGRHLWRRSSPSRLTGSPCSWRWQPSWCLPRSSRASGTTAPRVSPTSATSRCSPFPTATSSTPASCGIDCRYCHASVEKSRGRQRAADAGLHELPPAGRSATPSRSPRSATALTSGQPMRWVRVHKLAELRLLQPPRPRARRRRLRRAATAASNRWRSCTQVEPLSHGLVPRLPPRSRAEPAAALARSRTWTWKPARGPAEARGAPDRSDAPRPSADRLLGVPPVSADATGAASASSRTSPESRAFREREFPEGASEAPEGVTPAHGADAAGRVAVAGRPRRLPAPESRTSSRTSTPPEQIMPGVPRHYATTMPIGDERLRPGGREPRGPADQDRRQRAAPGDASARRALAMQAADPRPLRPRPLAARCCTARRGRRPGPTSSRPGRSARSRTPPTAAPGWRSLADALASSPTLARLLAELQQALPAGARRGDCEPVSRRERARRRRARRRPRAAAGPPPRQGAGDPRARRRPAARRPGDDPAHARLRGRPPRSATAATR